MIFTIGRTDIYEQYLDTDLNPRKSHGGSVWPSLVTARNYLTQAQLFEFSVYGVDADWDMDTIIEEDQEYRSLTRVAKLLRIE